MRVNSPDGIAPTREPSHMKEDRAKAPSQRDESAGKDTGGGSSVEVVLSEQSGQVATLLQALRDLPNTRADMVARARNRLQAAEAAVSSAQIADAILRVR
ncbi:flagellar biosynthesis anti-sigma factor FlgM [Candidatus Poribacteria bacterium]|jgi:hypothetical protein|nr:flagellar biosynthesis anti-sigma factor FlgM [Candidatus Poribacteria bacterium]MBT5536924.1 flagellar biosynthesis anti-sigma factor FlgM [Candidatus Poribacteria bacterium]MBT5709707.1 flagellar biosynthesis anti-sigma factor FlgM [Candidatus Poribacteria bacterium]MBT7101558.1 flagellar biosynthesis anti-sigma factor FlgM [Candidatus Poribacteria bacterium]MBT7807615.1 flagellar biosynthesis anti-sigma factor FlgM [Candidatus Poribacteria bacterium]